MSVSKNTFAELADGTRIYKFVIENKLGMKAEIINYGATLVSLWVKDNVGVFRDVVLGYDTIAGYQDNHPMFGVTVGRNINRISNAKFNLDGVEYNLIKNRGKHNIHSDKDNGFHKVVWDFEILDDNSIKLSYKSMDGEQGFPGTLNVSLIYSITQSNGLLLSYYAKTDKKTIINLSNHTYFNLGGHDKRDISSTQFYINADYFTPIDQDIIPTGEIRDVSNTPMDFRRFASVQNRLHSTYEQLQMGKGFDHNYVIKQPKAGLRKVAHAIDDNTKISMEVYSNMPGMQFYTANTLKNQVGKRGTSYQAHCAFCMEPDFFPNAINTEGFEKPIFDEHKEYCSSTIYQF